MVLALCTSSNVDWYFMKFLNDILDRFLVTERTWFSDGQSSNGNNSKSINARVTFLVLCTLSNADWYLYEVSWRKLERFLSYIADTILWQTDGQTDARGKTICLPTLRAWGEGGDIITETRGLDTLTREAIPSKLFCLPSEKGSLSERKEFAPWGFVVQET